MKNKEGRESGGAVPAAIGGTSIMLYDKEESGDSVKFAMRGRFVFSDHTNFRNVLECIESRESRTVRLDFKDVEFIDSAALGLLLLAKEKSDKASKKVVLERPTGQVAKMFRISRFQDMFEIVEADENGK
jgi:anti-anti-sigma factor